jgi:hypothetical protein
MLRAYPVLDSLRQPEPAVVAAWLRKILARTLADAANAPRLRDRPGAGYSG